MTTAGAECALAASRAVSPDTTQQAIGYPSLFLLVLLGALVPVVPTGAVVSSAAAVAFHHSNAAAFSLGVFAVAAAAAFLGDAVLYALGGRGVRSRNGSRWLDRIREQVAPEPLARAQERLARRGATVLLVSRLVPAGRIPVMLACLLARMPLHRYLRGNLPAVLGWAATYQLLGMLGGALFPHPWQGVVAAVTLTLLIAAAPVVLRRLRQALGRPAAGRPRPARGLRGRG
ncbi:DedA family protein [Streptomyces johnsoniae]|uniref:VTT domain-containing protein n=1 Tax=Streptomyces johnsoniae TaxID=3075532 RepID=A0ABU2S068_9ACTN|nr:VTT domain-containing protein [Streptomyces sp. DSM 41886]MDT0442397.1 VTT domain-containing protein [Streptomyces sp. DSM 41886]